MAGPVAPPGLEEVKPHARGATLAVGPTVSTYAIRWARPGRYASAVR